MRSSTTYKGGTELCLRAPAGGVACGAGGVMAWGRGAGAGSEGAEGVDVALALGSLAAKLSAGALTIVITVATAALFGVVLGSLSPFALLAFVAPVAQTVAGVVYLDRPAVLVQRGLPRAPQRSDRVDTENHERRLERHVPNCVRAPRAQGQRARRICRGRTMGGAGGAGARIAEQDAKDLRTRAWSLSMSGGHAERQNAATQESQKRGAPDRMITAAAVMRRSGSPTPPGSITLLAGSLGDLPATLQHRTLSIDRPSDSET